MQFLHIFTLFVATVMSTGFTIPSNQLDGVYEVSYDASGRAIHTFLREGVNNTEAQELAARDDGVNCGNYGLNHQDTDNAVTGLRRQCNPGAVGNGLDFYSITGSTVAYFCNFGATATVCQSNEVADSYTRISNACGLYGAGWRTVDVEHRCDGQDA
jgi:hypothetical protein